MDRYKHRPILFISGVIVIVMLFSFFFTYFKGGQPRLIQTDKECLVCHEDMSSSDTLSNKARGKTNLIFFHSTHSKGRDISCTTCHGEEDFHERRVPMELCLTCHDGSLASNDCSTCHGDYDYLEL